MYLKSLEVLGFKSFAQKTRLVFEPGITAIVGPNGCGKSNISDAIRWVLGEQRPTALRGSAMSDVIFSGTDSRKPLGMAEVSITFADCEDKLGTEYNEVTVSRRVFRSGEGQYFLNKTPCRLRDIHRLFMGTGIGTTSYSVMAQGQIDAILSSRPEDRRAVFEEASGITRFKVDRKEALRKLEQTEANLVRLTDVIREVKRQIGSLQRQAGKARRYTELRTELRALDLWVTARRVQALDRTAEEARALHEALAREMEALHEQTVALEGDVSAARDALMSLEQEIGQALESAMQAQGALAQAREALRTNEQRIAEYRDWSLRDEREIVETQAVYDAQRQAIDALTEQRTQLDREVLQAEEALGDAREHYEQQRQAVENARRALQALRGELLECERSAARTQSELAQAEAQARNAELQRERLDSERSQLQQSLEQLDASGRTLEGECETLAELVADHEERLAATEALHARHGAEWKDLQQQRAALQSRIAAEQARIQLLEDREENDEAFPAGSRLLLDPSNPLQLPPGNLLGPLAEHLSAVAETRRALEAALRPWLDAVVVSDGASAASMLATLLATGRPATTRLVAADGPRAPAPEAPWTRLMEAVECSDEARPAVARLLADVYLLPSLDQLPEPLPPGCTFVTLNGAVIHADGRYELWMPEAAASNPLARRLLAEDSREQLAALELELHKQTEQAERIAETLEQTEGRRRELRALLDECRHAAARKGGELQSCQRDAQRVRRRHEEVLLECRRTTDGNRSQTARKDELAGRLKGLWADRDRLAEAQEALVAEVQGLEQRHGQAQAALTEHRLRHAALSQQSDHLRTQHRSGEARLAELEKLVQGRSRGLQSYEESIRKLTAENKRLEAGLEGLQRDVAQRNAVAQELRASREERRAAIEREEGRLQTLRRTAEERSRRHSQAEVQLAEARMKRQNHLDRLANEYRIELAALHREPEPEWPDGTPPDLDAVDIRIAELRGQIDAIGPVNLVAIEEYRDHEERHAFLVAQEEDLVKGKAQILDLIRRINQESSALFRETFDKANLNFQSMFEKLFNGGTAQLVLLDSEDVLECGIDIIARPPGKRLQSVSLLSGGERTMTAVALLFAIYMIKPSPFALLDELDAALDDSNIGRFVRTLKEFLEMSQFVIITHNQHTIAGADIVYGVTMPEKGVSKIVSMRLKQVGVAPLEPGGTDDAPPSEPETLPPPPRRRRKTDAETAEQEGAPS